MPTLIELLNYLLVFSTGIVVGFINTLAGSGSLLTLPLLMFLGLDPLTANGTNRIAIFMQGSAGVWMFHREKQYQYRHDLKYILPAVAGSIPGAFIAVDLNQNLMQKVIAMVMLLMLVVMAINPQKRLKAQGIDVTGKTLLITIIFFLIGVYGGFIQAGVGIFILTGLSVVDEMNLLRANAVKVLITLVFTMAIIPVFIAHGQVNYLYGILLGAGSMGGTVISAKMAVKRGTPFMKAILYTVILATAVWMLISNRG